MRRCSAGDILLKALGLLLLTAAVFKGHELLTVPVVNRDLWSWRPFLIFQVEFELALGLWLLSGVFKRMAWLATLLCFSLFCCVTLYKALTALTGAASCGCFGVVHVHPWVTLAAIDLPAVIALVLFHPPLPFAPVLSSLRRQESIQTAVEYFLRPMPSLSRFTATAVLCLVILGLTTPILAFNKPSPVTSTYEVLTPETWVDKELPILKDIDIGEQVEKGTWLLLFYHHDCPHCQEVVPKYEQMGQDLAGSENLLRLALVEVPPYGRSSVRERLPCVWGRLRDVKQWFITTPTVVLTRNGKVRHAWEEGEAPELSAILAEWMKCEWAP